MAILEAGRQAMRRGLALLPWTSTAARRPAPGRDGPRIAVVGNCQARGVVRSLGILLPDARVTLFPASLPGKARRGLRGYDHVFAQPLAGQAPDAGGRDAPLGLPGARPFPAIVFSAFHPDMIYVGDLGAKAESALVPSPLHSYHSAIVLFGYLRGLSAERIAGLFREDTFAFLGYLDTWPLAVDDLAASSKAVGFDLSAEIPRWSRRGAFMHTINHPKLFVLADIAARLAREAGLAPATLSVEAYLTDDLLNDAIWPIYPPVADAYGLHGSYLFKRRSTAGAVPSLLDLDGFVAESLAIYRTMPAGRLTCHRIEHWSGVPEIRAYFDAG